MLGCLGVHLGQAQNVEVDEKAKRKELLQLLEWARTTTGPGKVFIDIVNPADCSDEHLVNVEEPWAALVDHLEVEKIAVIRAPPKSGKSLLGKLASMGRVEVLKKKNYEVRYCTDAECYEHLMKKFGFSSVAEMAEDSEASRRNASRTIVVYFFDEMDEIPHQIFIHFVKNQIGLAVLSTASVPRASPRRITPSELVEKTFAYHSPTSTGVLSNWLAGRLGKLLRRDHGEVGHRHHNDTDGRSYRHHPISRQAVGGFQLRFFGRCTGRALEASHTSGCRPLHGTVLRDRERST